MAGVTLKPVPLTRERFETFGDVIETARDRRASMNDARFDRFDDLAAVDVDARVAISIAQSRTATSLPYRFDTVERHPRGSQAFVPLQRCRMVVVVGPPGEAVAAADLRAFVTNGRQGINYHRGTWHMPLIAFDAGLEFLVVDRGGRAANCEQHTLDDVVILESV